MRNVQASSKRIAQILQRLEVIGTWCKDLERRLDALEKRISKLE